MNSPASALLLSVPIVTGAIAVVTAVSLLLGVRYGRRLKRSPLVVDSSSAVGSASALGSAVLSEHRQEPDSSAALEPITGAVSAEAVRRIVDPALPTVGQSHPWRPAGSRVWSKAESDGLIALFHLGTDLSALAAEMGLGERVLVEELARRIFGAVDPVVDPTMPRTGAAWSAADRAAIESVGRGDARLSDTAQRLGRDQLDVVQELIRGGRSLSHAETVR